MTIPLNTVAQRWLKEPGFKQGYDAMEDEYALASQLIEARTRAGMTQDDVARRMGTSRATVARFESGATQPTLAALKRFAEATGVRVRVTLVAPRQRAPRSSASTRATHGTRPYLYFGIRRNDEWIDPLSLKLDGDRLVSASLRSDFQTAKAEYDERLDAIELPPATEEPEPSAPAEGVRRGEEDRSGVGCG